MLRGGGGVGLAGMRASTWVWPLALHPLVALCLVLPHLHPAGTVHCSLRSWGTTAWVAARKGQSGGRCHLKRSRGSGTSAMCD